MFTTAHTECTQLDIGILSVISVVDLDTEILPAAKAPRMPRFRARVARLVRAAPGQAGDSARTGVLSEGNGCCFPS